MRALVKRAGPRPCETPLFVSPTTFLEVKADRTIAINGVVVTRVCVVER
jgi:hypothetical protein